MDPTVANMQTFFTGLQTSFNAGFSGVEADWKKIAMTVPSKTSGETYAWMNDLPKMREWVGSRVLRQISEHTYTLANKKWEDTIVVPKDKIEDDQYGIYGPLTQELGRAAAEHPGELMFDLLMNGTSEICYDGQNFFDEDHPVVNPETDDTQSVSNYQDGGSAPWFLLDTTRVIKPLVFQDRKKAQFNSLTDPKMSEHVFMNDEFVYGADARYNGGYSFWQMARMSKAELSQANLRSAIDSMKKLESDEGRKLGIKPNLLVVGIGNAHVARDLIKAERLDGGKSNTDVNIVEIMKCPYFD